MQLGYKIGEVGEALIEESPNKHSLRSRLCLELDGTLKAMIEEHDSLLATPDRYSSAMLIGDVGTALHCHRLYCVGSFMTGSPLISLSKHFITCIQQLVSI